MEMAGDRPSMRVHIGLVHLAQELAGVGGKRFHVAALALGVDGVEGQSGFARAGDAGDDDEFVSGQLYGDVFEVVLAGTFYYDRFHFADLT